MSKYTLEGYLEKTGAKGPLKDRFQKRWFSVKQGETQVQYFSTKDSKKAAGAIDLTQVRLVIKPLEVADEIDRRKSARGSAIANGSIFEVHTLDRIYRLKAISPEDADNWIRNLKLIIDDIRPSKQPPLPLGSELISDVEKQRLATFPSQTSSTLLRSSNFPPTPTKMAPQPISFSSALSSLPTVMLSTNEQLHSEISSSTASSRNEHNSVPISTTDVLKPPNFLDLMDDDDDGEKGESNENHSPPEPTRSRLLGSSPIAHVTHNPNESPLLHSQATVADPRCVVPPLDYHPQMMEITEPDVDEQSCNRSGDSRSSHTLSSSPLTFGTSLQPSPLVENMRINVGERETPGIPLQEHQNGPSSLLDLTTADSQKQKQLICQLESQLSRLKRSFDEKESHHQIVLQNLKKENLRLLQENQSSQKDCISGSLQIELSKSKQDGSNLSTESVSRDQEIESTRERLAASESFASQKNQEVLELERELQVLKSQRSTILNENSSLLNAQIDSLKEKNCRLEEQLQLLVDQEQKISNFSDTLGKKDESISYMQHQISDLKQQIQYCSERLSQSESKTQFLLQEKASLETQLKSTVKTDSNASTSANLISPAFAVSPSLSENEKRLKELEEVVSHLKETNSKLLSQLNSERASKAILSSQLLALQAASQKRGNQTERDKDEEGHSSAKESEGGLRNMMKELKSSRIQIATQNEEIESMKLKIKELEALISILEESKADSDDDLLTKSSHSYPYQQQQQQQTQMQMQTQMQNNLKSVERVTTYAPKHSSSSSSLAVEQTLKIAGGDCKFGYLNDDDETVLQRIISLEKTVSLYRNKYEQLEIEIELLRNNLLLNNQKNAELASDNRIKVCLILPIFLFFQTEKRFLLPLFFVSSYITG